MEKSLPSVSGSMLERELELTEEDLVRISEWIYQRAGIVLASHKRGMVYSRLARLVKNWNCSSFEQYLDILARTPEGAAWEQFTNALTTNLTSFFREAHHFTALARHLKGRGGPVRIWCTAASTGEEPYSIAMTMRNVLGDSADIHVLATDIDTHALARAEEGIYPLSQVSKLDDDLVRRYFLKGRGAWANSARVRPELAATITFAQLNLVAPSWPLKAPFDAIFCRNVMIYFDKKTQARILARFVPLLKPGALLFAGHSESFTYLSNELQLLGQTVYCRPA